MHICSLCQWPFASQRELEVHMDIKHKAQLSTPPQPEAGGDVKRWNDLTVGQKKRLVAISRGEQLDTLSQEYLDLVELKLVQWFINLEAENIDYLTPLGGELLRQREAILVCFVETCLYDGEDGAGAGIEGLAQELGIATAGFSGWQILAEAARKTLALAQVQAQEAGVGNE